jgi:site-specific DNA-methyltransferase (cytosine-N4-specific)
MLNGSLEERLFNSVKEIDWDFKGADTTYLTHNYHSYPARFIPQIPRTIIELFSSRYETVLDPFVGCGTTLVEALLLGRRAIGIDINPLATLISKVKSTPIEPTRLESSLEKINGIVQSVMVLRGQSCLSPIQLPEFKIPLLPKRKLTAKFSEEVKKELACIKAKILEIDDEDVKDFLLVAFSATIRTVVESKSREPDVLNIFLQDVKMMNDRMKKFYQLCPKEVLPAQIYCADFREANFLEDHSIDVIVTSPTYVNAYDYHREHMFNIFWLNDYLYEKFHMDFDKFRCNELGSHSHYIYNRFKTVVEYFEGLYKCFQQMSRVLKPGRICCVVVGDSTVEQEYIRTHQYFKEIGEEVGLTIKVDILRNIDVESKYLSKTIGKINQEHVLIFKKTSEGWEKGDSKNYTRNLLNRLLATCRPKNKVKVQEVLEEFS